MATRLDTDRPTIDETGVTDVEIPEGGSGKYDSIVTQLPEEIRSTYDELPAAEREAFLVRVTSEYMREIKQTLTGDADLVERAMAPGGRESITQRLAVDAGHEVAHFMIEEASTRQDITATDLEDAERTLRNFTGPKNFFEFLAERAILTQAKESGAFSAQQLKDFSEEEEEEDA